MLGTRRHTLLHLAVEYDDIDVAQWLIERGADVNAKAALDADGFGGHTPLCHTVVTLAARDEAHGQAIVRRVDALPGRRGLVDHLRRERLRT